MSREVTALVFGPGLPPGGAQGSLSISSLGVEVIAGERSQRVPISQVQLREAGFGEFGLELAWNDGADAWAAHVLNSDAARALLNQGPLASTPQAQALVGTRQRSKVGRSIGWTLLAAFVLLPILLLLLLVLNANRIAGWIAERIPVQQEMEWGRQAFAGMRGSLRLHDEGAAFTAVNAIGAKLTQGSQFHYEFHISDDKALNAFAVPGGIVVVNSGLIATTKRPEELAGVLAHEVQHVELRHSLRASIKELGLRGLWAFATGDLGDTIAGHAALELTRLKFSRDDESEADQRGFDALVRAGIDPSGMAQFFKTMSEQAADAPVSFISTHPLSVDREAALAKRASELKQSFAPLDLGSWPPTS